MANVKNGSFREIIIDRCLRNRRGFSTQEIMDKCNDALYRRGEPEITALNTIRNDIEAISDRWGEVIETVRCGRNIRYRYENPDFSIFNSPLNEDEICQLSKSVAMLRRFEGSPGFEWVDELNARLQTIVNIDSRPIIGFGENTQLKGMEFFMALFNHIQKRQAISIKYKPYEASESIETIIHPYFLKEYNQRWFLLALSEEYRTISTYALDRIEEIEKVSIDYIDNKTIDFSSYYKDVIGVSMKVDMPVQTIKIKVEKEQLPYILTKPIHPSQKLEEKFNDGSGIISFQVKPNFELKSMLLSFGEKVTVIEPADLREEIIGRLKKNIQNYEQIHLD